MPSIQKRGANSWRLIVSAGYDADGKLIQFRKTIRIEDEAILKSKRKLDELLETELVMFRREVESGLFIKQDRTTFKKFIPTWKDNYANQRLGEYTRRNYQYIIDSRLIPAFGHMELSKIKTMHIVSFLTQLRSSEGRKDGENKPLSFHSILNIYKTLKSILDAAAKWKVIASNPMEGVDRPTTDKEQKKELRSKKRTYTPLEVDQLIAVLYKEPENWRLYFIGVLLSGFRRGEMLAVEWTDVDFELSGIHVRKQISFDEKGQAKESELKTEESEAFITMPKWYMDELTAYRKNWIKEKFRLGDKWVGGDKQYLFHGGEGQMYYPNTPSLTWRRFLESNNLPRIRLHDLRHTSATLLRDKGVDLKTIQERLRHTRLSTTADIYTHESLQANREAADQFEGLAPSRSKI